MTNFCFLLALAVMFVGYMQCAPLNEGDAAESKRLSCRPYCKPCVSPQPCEPCIPCNPRPEPCTTRSCGKGRGRVNNGGYRG